MIRAAFSKKLTSEICPPNDQRSGANPLRQGQRSTEDMDAGLSPALHCWAAELKLAPKRPPRNRRTAAGAVECACSGSVQPGQPVQPGTPHRSTCPEDATAGLPSHATTTTLFR
jgi:hypothetical protein